MRGRAWCRCRYFVTVTRKLGVDPRIARRKVELLAEFDVAAPGVADILAAIDLHRLHGFSFWDALILRAAKQAGCRVLFSEGMQDGGEIDGVRIVNPFGLGDKSGGGNEVSTGLRDWR